MPKTAIAIRHLAFEDLGAFEPVLVREEFEVRYWDIGLDDLAQFDPLQPDLLVVLGGPIGVYEEDRYPFLTTEIAKLRTRLAAGRPTLGICLGAQLIARALDAAVHPGPHKEIGFAPIALSTAGRTSCLAAFDDAPVLHWHGDTFDLPPGAELLASTAICPHQAFALGPTVLAVQFHPEAGGPGFERWLIGHTLELSQAGLDAAALRSENARLGPGLRQRAEACLQRWLLQLPA